MQNMYRSDTQMSLSTSIVFKNIFVNITRKSVKRKNDRLMYMNLSNTGCRYIFGC